MRRTLCFASSVLALGVASAAHAQRSDQAPAPDVAGPAAATAAQEVVVVANRAPAPLVTVAPSVTILTLPELRADQEPALADILARTPGVALTRNGGPGQTTSLSIRGADSDQTVVLIDGVKINDPSSPASGFDYSNLLVGDISRVEVLRGIQSVLYGSQAMGGVVNIVTADATKAFQGDAQIEGGSYSTGYAKAAVGGRNGPWSWRLAADAYTTGGVSAFAKQFGGKEADGNRNEGVSGRLGYAFTPDVSLDLRGVYIQSRTKFDGFSTPTFSFGDDSEYGALRQSIAYAGLNFGLLDGRLKNRLAAQYTLTQRDSYDPADAPTTKTFDGRGVNARVEYQGSYEIAPGWRGVFGAQNERESITTSSPAFDFPPGLPPTKADATTNSAYGQLQGEVIAGLNLTGGVRYDDHSTFGGHTTGQFGAAWSLNGGDTVLRATWGQGFKAPSLYQLFSQYGNATLRPEEAHGWDAGVQQRFLGGKVDVQATYFNRDTTNLIGFAATPACTARQFFGCYNNTARAEARGVELSGAVRPLDGLELTANYTYTDATDRSPGAATFGKDLARRPHDTANLAATYVWPVKLSTTVAVRYAGDSFDNASNTRLLKSYTLVDLRAAYPLGHGLEVYGRIENLFDKTYETAAQYGNPGRAGYLGLRAVF
ncbi:MAG: TonB-dependent receptor [Pseudomonadota bacterium]|nr:TonB-dependent receptor [Pseudomonadota bacterium]